MAVDDEDNALRRRLGARVKLARQRRGLTLKAVGERSGLSSRYLSEVEAGRANPSLGSLRELARAIGTDLLALLYAGPMTEAHEGLLAYVQELDAARAKELLTRLGGEREERARRTIALLGLRGAGKSSVGERLAARLGRRFLELNQLIEREAGMQLGHLFELHGAEHVRELEHRVLRDILDGGQPSVVATGGGLVTNPESWRELRERACTVWLRATPQQHWDRVIEQGDLRPMANRSRGGAQRGQLYRARAPLYERADVVVDTTELDVDAVCEGIVAALRP